MKNVNASVRQPRLHLLSRDEKRKGLERFSHSRGAVDKRFIVSAPGRSAGRVAPLLLEIVCQVMLRIDSLRQSFVVGEMGAIGDFRDVSLDQRVAATAELAFDERGIIAALMDDLVV